MNYTFYLLRISRRTSSQERDSSLNFLTPTPPSKILTHLSHQLSKLFPPFFLFFQIHIYDNTTNLHSIQLTIKHDLQTNARKQNQTSYSIAYTHTHTHVYIFRHSLTGEEINGRRIFTSGGRWRRRRRQRSISA